MIRALVLAITIAVTGVPPASAQTLPALRTLYVNDAYDPRANPYRDLERALDRAEAENKRVLLVLGGDWCVWCEILDRYLVADLEARAAFEATFVILKVNVSLENENEAFLSGFPQSEAYPDFLVLDSRGAYLGRQRTDLLERDRTYDRTRMVAFARRWRP